MDDRWEWGEIEDGLSQAERAGHARRAVDIRHPLLKTWVYSRSVVPALVRACKAHALSLNKAFP